MRARGIKPSICDNELLGTSDPYHTLLFERLWMIADRDGRLEDRPLRIKAQSFPYRDGLDVEPMLAWLAENGFIERYTVAGSRFIQVVKFSEHQRPHKNEQPSVIPPNIDHGITKGGRKHNHGSAVDALTPSSLTADSGLLTADIRTSAAPTTASELEWFADFKLAYPPRAGDQGWRRAHKAARARQSEGHSPEEIIAGARRYAAFVDATGKRGTEYVKQAASFLGPDKPFLLPWNPPPSKAQVRQDKNLDASLQWLADEEAKDAAH